MYKFRIESSIEHVVPSPGDALNATGMGYFLKDATLQYVQANEQILNMLDVPHFKAIDEVEVYGTKLADEFRQIESNILTTELPHKQEVVVSFKNKEQKVFRISRSIYKKADQSYICGFVEDITEERQDRQFDAFKEVLTESEKYEKLINRFSSYIFNNNDLETILNGVSKLCVDLLELEDVCIFLLNKEEETLEQRSVWSKNENFLYQDVGQLKLNFGEGIVGQAAAKKATRLINDVNADENYIKFVLAGKSELAVPIIFKQQLIGVIDTESTVKNYYTERHVQLLEGIASLLAIKLNELQNTQLLQQKQTQLEAFIVNSPVALVMLDNNYNYLAVSDSWKKTFKFSKRTDLLGKNHFEMQPDLPIRWKNMVVKSATEGKVQSIKKEFYQKADGSHEWFTATVNPWFLNEEEIGGVIITADIITDKVEKDLHLSETFEELQEARKLGKLFTWEFDAKVGKFVWSANITEFGNGESEHLEGVSLFDLIEPEFKADFSNKIATAIDNLGKFEVIHPIRLNNTRFWLHTRGNVIANGNKISKIQGTVQDITEQMSTEESLRRKNDELQKINEELDQFVYKTAHDLRAPLANMTGLIGVMRNETDPNLLNTYFDLQEKSIDRLDSFIQKITTYTKNARMPIQAQKVDCVQLVDEIFSEYLFYEKSDRVEKVVDISQELDAYTDRDRLKIILNNLVANAIKFSDTQKHCPSLMIHMEPKFDEILIEVKDNGIGIAPQIQSKVFDMFYRGHNSADGAGIGLYIVKETVKKLNGKISLTSDLGKGTSVQIRIPNLNPKILK
ncbi:PAS domain S-box protein [bacterium]|nr:PAS domain S-box protein [bacterium]